MSELKWESYGDVNPLEHGGTWVRPTERKEYHIVKVTPYDDQEGVYRFEDVYLDDQCLWIEWGAVYKYADLTENSDPELKVMGAVDYYGGLESGGEQFDVTREVAERLLKEYDIKF
jgi:hypothetical protein